MKQFTESILQWYAEQGRDLPWRNTRDPYAIWLSEVILQQTRIEQGRAYWERFMERFPKVEDLAAASEDEVLRLWQGLGYYSRARNLHAAAQQIVTQGVFPNTFERIKALKGVGDYTAAAIASFAFDESRAVLDGNVFRVLARHEGIDIPIDTTQGKHLFAALAQEMLPEGRAADYNQGIMDFGALMCTPHAPHCSDCPLQETCVAFREKRVQELPVKSKRLVQRERHFTYLYLRWQGNVALHRRTSGDIWQGLWEPLLIENAPLPNIKGRWTLVQQQMKHVLTHQIIYADMYLVEQESDTAAPLLPPDYCWIPEENIGQYALPRLVERLLTSLTANR